MKLALECGAAYAVVAGQILSPTFHIPGETIMERPLWRLFVREPALPGGVVVDQNGKRFCDESFYRAIVYAFTDFDLTTQSHRVERAFFVFDAEWKAKYALGSVRPGDAPVWLLSGSAADIESALSIPAGGLEQTIAEYNAHAAIGEDPQFGRGKLIYARNNGDRDVAPNPCVRPLEGRLHAIEIHLGTLGGSGGLCFDTKSRVIGWNDEPLPGLYCAGNVGASLVEGLWYNSGLANGRAIAFGRRAGQSAVRDAVDQLASMEVAS
jgi:succinate dehydrogenase/fumarate reductase flavoprotein subunit